MAKPDLTKTGASKPVTKEKAKALAFVNWTIRGEDGKVLLRSTRGFSLLDNEYLTLEEKALIELATQNGGSAIVAAELRVILAQEKPTHLDISGIKLIQKAV
jgi:hypothetical protein